jgi:3D (Asp-Asp-Asp) domain-containing protein
VLKAEGKPGESLVIWRVYYRNGKEVRRVKVREEVLEPPQPRIYEIGVHGHIASRGAVGRSGAFRTVKVLTMHASAYTPHRSGGGTGSGRTATGLPAGYGLVAVDPRVIPLGTVLYIEGYGMAIAADTGRAIRGHKIDLCYATRQQAIQFGRRKVRVHILRAAPAAPPPKPPDDAENADDAPPDPDAESDMTRCTRPSPDLLTRYEGTRAYPRAVTAVLSGNRIPRCALMPWVSDSWARLFRWNFVWGKLNTAQR